MSVWAKSPRHSMDSLPLWRHLDDSAAVAGHLWDRWVPTATRQVIADGLPDGDDDGRRLAVWLAGIHDIGKATPAFAAQVPWLCDRMRIHGLDIPDRITPEDRRHTLHATTGHVLLERWLAQVHGWSAEQATPYAVVVGGHHGVPPDDVGLRRARERRSLLGLADHQQVWQQVHRELLDRAAAMHRVSPRLPHWQRVSLSQPAQVLLTALVIVADWIASNEELFTYDLERLHAPDRLAAAWHELDLPRPWQPATVEFGAAELFARRFRLPGGATPHPVQTAAVELARTMPVPGLMIIEAPMGEGKTEAALAATEVLAGRSGAGGCFVALPTRATSDAMFSRVRDWLGRIPRDDTATGPLSVSLAHGKARFNDDFSGLLRRGQIRAVAQDYVDEAPPTRGRPASRELTAHRWLQGRKKAMLSSFVVGTIDQLLFGALKSRHLAMRHLGLAGKVVIIDEAHAYDVYMSQYLDRALEWLAAYRVPTIVLSATLPARRRRQMLQAYDRGRGVAPVPAPRRPSWRDGVAAGSQAPDPYAVLDGDIGYPVLTASGADARPAVQVTEPSGRTTPVTVAPFADDLPALAEMLATDLADGGCALVVRNTVRRVQETAAHLRPALAAAGIDVTVAHSRFLAPDRADKDRWLRESFGPPDLLAAAGGKRPARHIVVASQVAEQSLDIDFDLLVTDLAPVDLVLQRAGRLHRHQRGADQADRPPRLRTARLLITGVDWSATPPEPVRGSRQVYGHHPLLRALAVLHPFLAGAGTTGEGAAGDRVLRLPHDIAPLVQAAYGDEPPGPDGWQDVMQRASRHHAQTQQAKERTATTFRLAGVGRPGQPVVGWLNAQVGDVDDDPRLDGRKQVRDSAAESVDVLVVVRRDDGTVVTPPWLRRDGGREVPLEHTPPPDLARVVASCTLSLPYELCRIEAIEELEKSYDFPAWRQSPWLDGELVLVLDARGEAEVWGHRIRYDPHDGLSVTRAGRAGAGRARADGALVKGTNDPAWSNGPAPDWAA
jgi:CRISPR-associated endonuclease/helicase Cas3